MDNKIIYHGSNMKVEIPKIMINGYYKDFGYGFYCTNLKKQAIRWAMTKKGDSVINTYSYQRNENLQIKTFEEMTEEWLQFVVDCRRGIEHNYDIVEGPMADDQIYNFVSDYMDGTITREQFWVLTKFKYPTHQIAFCSKESLKCLKYRDCEVL